MARFVITGEYKDKATKDARKDLRLLTRDTVNFGKIAQKYWKLAAKSAAAYYAIRYGTQAVRAAAEDERSQKLLANTLTFVAGANQAAVIAAEANIKAMTQMYGVADDDLRPALAKLARVTGSVSVATNDLNLALSLSTATGYSLETVSNAITKAYNGNYKSLKSLGLKLDENLVKKKQTSAILKKLKVQYEDFAQNSLDTTAVKFQKIKIAADEAKETIGVALVDAINKLVAGQGGVDGITTKFEQLSNHISDIIYALTDLAERTKKVDTATGNILGKTAKWIYQNWTILGVLGKQGKQLKINEGLIKSATQQTISARNAEMTALREKKKLEEPSDKTVLQLIAEKMAREAGFKVTEDLDSLQTIAAAKRLEESRQYKASVIDAAQAQYEAIKRNYEMLGSTWEVQKSAFDVFLAYLKSKSVTIPVNFTGGALPTPGSTPSLAAALPEQAIPSFMGGVGSSAAAGDSLALGGQTINITVNAGAIGSEEFLVGAVGDALTKYTRYGNTTAPAGFI